MWSRNINGKKEYNTKNAPAVSVLTRNVVDELNKDATYKTAIDEIIDEISEDKFNIESFLSI